MWKALYVLMSPCASLRWSSAKQKVINTERCHNSDVIMSTTASQITSLTIVYSTVYSGADQRKHQSSASLAFVRGIHRRPVNSPHKWPVTLKMFPFDDVIMAYQCDGERGYDLPPDLQKSTVTKVNMCQISSHLCDLSIDSYRWLFWISLYSNWPPLMDHSGYGPSQWETTLQCNVVSHWLSRYRESSLRFKTGAWGRCNIGYPMESHLKLKSREISFVNILFLRCQIVLKFYT